MVRSGDIVYWELTNQLGHVVRLILGRDGWRVNMLVPQRESLARPLESVLQRAVEQAAAQAGSFMPVGAIGERIISEALAPAGYTPSRVVWLEIPQPAPEGAVY